MKSTREVGKQLENLVLAHLQAIEPRARLSNNSGAVSNNGDITNSDYFQIECKVKNTDSITIKNDVFKKLVKSIPMHINRMPVLVNQNKEKYVYVTMEMRDFFKLADAFVQKEKHG
jgi:hypothetical protein